MKVCEANAHAECRGVFHTFYFSENLWESQKNKKCETRLR